MKQLQIPSMSIDQARQLDLGWLTSLRMLIGLFTRAPHGLSRTILLVRCEGLNTDSQSGLTSDFSAELKHFQRGGVILNFQDAIVVQNF